MAPRKGSKHTARSRYLLELGFTKAVPVVPRTRLPRAAPVKPSRWALKTPAERAAHAAYLRAWRLTWPGLERHRERARERSRERRRRMQTNLIESVRQLNERMQALEIAVAELRVAVDQLRKDTAVIGQRAGKPPSYR